jgi:hypothetical protein
MAAFLRQIGGREIDGDALRRQRETGGDQRRAHALARFGYGLVRKTDDVEGGKARRDLHLHVDRARFHAFEGTSDPYFTSDGHDVGRDETVAILYAQRIDLTPTASELADSALYADRLLSDLEAIKRDYRSSEDDPEGYGIGTLHSLSRALAPFRRA